MEKAENGFWGSVNPKVKTGIAIGATTLIIGGISFYIIRKKAKQHKSRKILKNAIHEGSVESIVEKINVAVDGAGTDEQKVYEAFAEIPTQKAADTVAKMYFDAYDETLDEALRGDLDTDELQTVKNITASKPKNKGAKSNYDLLGDWVTRLKKASGTFSTDEDAIYRVLWEVPDKNGLAFLSNTMKRNTEIGNLSLPEFLIAQLGEGDLETAKYIIAKKT